MAAEKDSWKRRRLDSSSLILDLVKWTRWLTTASDSFVSASFWFISCSSSLDSETDESTSSCWFSKASHFLWQLFRASLVASSLVLANCNFSSSHWQMRIWLSSAAFRPASRSIRSAIVFFRSINCSNSCSLNLLISSNVRSFFFMKSIDCCFSKMFCSSCWRFTSAFWKEEEASTLSNNFEVSDWSVSLVLWPVRTIKTIWDFLKKIF